MIYPAQFKEVFEEINDADAGFLHSVSKGFIVTFRDIPEAITRGNDFVDATEMATRVLLVVMQDYDERGEGRPTPSGFQVGDIAINL